MPDPDLAETSKICIPGRTLSMFGGQRKVKIGGLGQIHLGDERHIGAVEDGRILQRLVFAFRGREQDEAEFFAEIIAGRADEIADVEGFRLFEGFFEELHSFIIFQVTDVLAQDGMSIMGQAERILQFCPDSE